MEISKRDYFAAHALTGLLAHHHGPAGETEAPMRMATEAYHYADAMLKLSKTLMDPVEIDPAHLVKEPHGAGEPQKFTGA